MISETRKITLQIRLFMIFVSPDVMENPTYDPNSVSNILSCSHLPDFLTEMTFIIFSLNVLNGVMLLDPILDGVRYTSIKDGEQKAPPPHPV